MRSVDASFKKIDGLIDRAAFDSEVEGIVEESGSLFTPELAAAMVVDRLGRSEYKVPPLEKARPGATTVVRGFVARVQPVREFEETQFKARALLAAIDDAERQANVAGGSLGY